MHTNSISPALSTTLLFLAFLGTLAAPFAARADVQPPAASTCTAGAPIEPGDFPVAPGLWWNPKREGTGWNLVRNANDLLIVTWFTYGPNGGPVWLQSAPVQVNAGAETWSSPLNRVTWNYSNDTYALSQVGSVAIRFLPTDPGRVAIRWEWGVYGDDECIIDFSRTAPSGPAGPSPQNANVLFSGAWHEPLFDGYGDYVNIIHRQLTNDYFETHTLTLYDLVGSPVWVQSQDSRGANPPPVGDLKTANLLYFRSGYQGGVPVSDCINGLTPQGFPCFASYPAGQQSRTFQDSETMRSAINATVASNYLAPDAAAISWLRGVVDGTMANLKTLKKITKTQGIVVDRFSCTAPEGATICNVVVNWFANDPGSRATRVQVSPGAGQNVAVQIPPAQSTGEHTATLPAGHVYKFELRSSGGALIGYTAHVSALQGASAVVPDAAVESLNAELPTHDASIGAVDGKAGVSGGAATYTLAINLPPGRRGMQPNLALSYSSRSGNGIAGMGWSLSGLSSIHRCPRTVAQDGYTRPVMFDQRDALCLDGQRLVGRVTNVYGTDGATYATEIDSFARVTQLGGNLTSSATYFKVEHKSGEIHFLGSASTAGPFGRSTPNGAPAPLSWLLVERQDRTGNTVSYSYLQNGFGEVLLNRVDYTGFGTNVGNRSVSLIYEDRPGGASGFDSSSSYLAGTESRQTKRLQQILTHAPNASNVVVEVRRYRLAYVSGANSNRSVLLSVTECAIDGTETCLQATTFDTSNVASTTRTEQLHISSDPLVFPVTGLPNDFTPELGQDTSWAPFIHSSTATADFNGDGTRELLVQTLQKSNNQGGQKARAFLVSLTADRVVNGVFELLAADATALLKFPRAQADFDGDGRTDIITTSGNKVAFKFWRAGAGNFAGGGFITTAIQTDEVFLPPNTDQGAISYLQHAGDVDGDGRSDLIIVRHRADLPSSCTKKVELWLNKHDPNPQQPFEQLNFDLQSSPLPEDASNPLCLGQHFDQVRSVSYVEEVGRVADIDGNGLLDLQIDPKSTPSGALTWIEEVVFLHREAATSGTVGCTPSTTGKALGFCRRSFAELISSQAGNLATLRETQATNLTHFWADLNGDGVDDWLYADTSGCSAVGKPATGSPLCWSIRFGTGRGMQGYALSPRYETGVRRGLEQNAAGSALYPRARHERLMRIGDTNSDGRAELLIPDAARPFATVVCTAYTEPCPAPPNQCSSPSESPSSPVTFPTPGNDYFVCPTSPSHTDGEPRTNAGPFASRNVSFITDIDRDGIPDIGSETGVVYVLTPDQAPNSGGDASTYRLRPWSFALGLAATSGGAGSIAMVENTQRAVLSSGQSEDVFGDGLTDGITQLPHPRDSAGSIPRLAIPYRYSSGLPVAEVPQVLVDTTVPVFWRALVLEQNLGAGERPGLPPQLPEMLVKATDGLGKVAQWEHFPLSSSAGRNALSTPLYRVEPRTTGQPGYVDSQHLYFASSMPVVAKFDQSDGNGGLRTTQFGYGEAMYNVAGRGFQGFRTVIEEDLVNFRRTRTTFDQKFPTTGLVQETVSSAIDGMQQTGVPTSTETNLIARETRVWACSRIGRRECPRFPIADPVNGTVIYFPFVDSTTTTSYDVGYGASGSVLTTTTTQNYDPIYPGVSGWDGSGNLNRQTITVAEFGEDRSLDSHTTKRVWNYSVDTGTDWWLDRIASETTNSSLQLKAGDPVGQGAVPPYSIAKSFTWNEGSRTPNVQVLQPGITNQQIKTTFGYAGPAGIYGQPHSVAVEASGDFNQSGGQSIRTTQMAYSANGSDGYFTELVTNPLSHQVSTVARARDGQPISVTDAKGLRSDFVYDPFGQLIYTGFPSPSGGVDRLPAKKSAVSACLPGSCIDDYLGRARYKVTEVQNGAPTTTTTFDLLRRPIRVKSKTFNGSETVAETLLTNRGLVFRQYEPHPPSAFGDNTMFMGYDVLGRPSIKRVFKSGGGPLTVLTVSYAYMGRLTYIDVSDSVTGRQLPQMTRTADAWGRQFLTTDSLGGQTRTWFDAMGNPVAIRDVNGSWTRATYNAVGHRLTLADPNKGNWAFNYNALGELRSQTDARGIATGFSYDLLGRMLARTAPVDIDGIGGADSVVDTWLYDPINGRGELSSSERRVNTATERSESHSYDGNARLVSTAYQQARPEAGAAPSLDSYIATWRYDTNYGRPKEWIAPNGERVWYRYDRYGHPLSETDPVSGLVYRQTQAVNGRGQVIDEQFGGTIRGLYDFHPGTGEVRSMAYTVNSVPRRSLGYVYDGFGNLIAQSNQSLSESYIYDDLHRLKKTTRTVVPGVTVNGIYAPVDYTYDAAGNIRSKSDFSTTAADAYTYDANSKPNAVRSVALSGGGSMSYGYDPNGNMISSSASFMGRYDHQDLPVAVSKAGGINTELRYGPDGSRTRQWGTDGARIYIGKGFEKVGTTEKVYVGDYAVVTRTGAVRKVDFLLKDRLGSVDTVVAQADGTTGDSRGYDAFGKPRLGTWVNAAPPRLSATGALITPRGFTQHEHLNSLELIHMNGRVYDYNLGRFLSVDPIIQFPDNSQSLNPYSYILNNPLSGTDPTGYASCSVNDNKNCLESGSNKIYDDKGNYLGKVNVNGKSVSFAPTQAGMAYANGGRSGSGTSGERGSRAPSDVGRASSSSRSSGSAISETVSNAPIALGDDPNSDQTRDGRGFGATVPGVGFAQCVTGSADCSGGQTAAQGAGAMLGFFAPVMARGLGTFFRGAAAESPWLLGPGPRGIAIENMLGHNLPRTFPTIDKFSNGLATSIKSIDLAAKSYQNPAALTRTLNGYLDKVARFQGGRIADFNIRAAEITGRQLQLAIPAGYTMTAGQQAAIQAAAGNARAQGLSFVVTRVP